MSTDSCRCCKKMPPYAMAPVGALVPGPDSIRAFLAHVWRGRSGFASWPRAPTEQPAFALYNCKPADPTYRAHSIEVLEIQGDAIVALTKYMRPLAPELFAEFGLPLTLSQ